MTFEFKRVTGYEVWCKSPDGSTTYFVGHGSETEKDAVTTWQSEHPEAVVAELRKREWMVDPDCEQESMCLCGPITEWEKVRDL